MTAPAQRITDLESSAWRTERRLEKLDSNVAQLHTKVDELQTKVDQHGVALSATMRDLRDFRIEVTTRLDNHTAILNKHTVTLDNHTAILNAIVKHFRIELPATQEAAPE